MSDTHVGRRLAFACAAASLMIAVGSAQQAAAPAALPNVQALGPQVGGHVPDFTLLDQSGHARSLKSLMGPKGLMLVFYRSADWCPYCKTQLAELQGRTAELARQGLGLAAISYDPAPILADFSKRRGVTFPLLSDPGSATIKQYGIFNTTVPASDRQSYGIPFPGTFIVNPKGIVLSRFFEQAYQERATVGSILARMGDHVDVQATRIAAPQIEITSFVTDATVAPGTHFSIVADVRPARGVHVYAPGNSAYKPIALTVDAQPGLVLRGSQYPQPDDYYFKPLNEHVKVFDKPFRILQDVMIDASPQAQGMLRTMTAVSITGTIAYQACSETLCYAPQSVPLTWSVALRRLDVERPKP